VWQTKETRPDRSGTPCPATARPRHRKRLPRQMILRFLIGAESTFGDSVLAATNIFRNCRAGADRVPGFLVSSLSVDRAVESKHVNPAFVENVETRRTAGPGIRSLGRRSGGHCRDQRREGASAGHEDFVCFSRTWPRPGDRPLSKHYTPHSVRGSASSFDRSSMVIVDSTCPCWRLAGKERLQVAML